MHTRAQHSRQAQKGSAALTMLFIMLGLISILGLVEVGYLFWAKRDLQKVVDLAALAGAQRLETCNANLSDNAAARSNAVNDNGFQEELVIRCGYWDSNVGHVVSSPGQNQQLDAVQVDGSRSAIPFLGQIDAFPRLRARAIARSGAPIAAFSVGSRLLDINSGAALQQVLKLVGVDLTGTSVGTFDGLAGVKITPRGLLQALGLPVEANIGAGELNQLLAARQVSIAELIDAVAEVGAQQGVASVGLDALNTRLAQLDIHNAMVRLGSQGSNSGLFAQIAAGASAANAALDTQVDVLSLVTAGLQIANGQHAVDVPGLNIAGAIRVQASVVEPPSLAIGPVGTTAYNSQIRLFVDVDTDRTAVIGSLLKILGVQVKLPIYIDVVDGYGRLESVDCVASPSKANIGVTSAVANICVGKNSVPWNSTRELCANGISNETLVKLLGLKVLETHIKLPALSDYERVTLGINEWAMVSPNSLALGTLVSNLVDTLLGTLGSLFSQNQSTNNNATKLAENYLEATKDPATGLYNAERVINALKNGVKKNPLPPAGQYEYELPPLGTWQTDIPVCTSWVLFSSCKMEQGDVWVGYKNSTTVTDASVLGGLLQVLGVTACDGLLSGLLAYNVCLRDSLAKHLQTKPGGLQNTAYNPVTGTGSCGSVLCILIKPLVDTVLRPLLNSIGQLLSSVLGNILGIHLGQSVVKVHDIQCGRAELVY